MAAIETIPHKRGDSFVVEATLEDEATGERIPLDDFVITSQVCTAAGERFDLVVAKSNEAGAYQVTAPAEQTAEWPAGPLTWDIQYRLGDQVVSTETCRILVRPDVTR